MSHRSSLLSHSGIRHSSQVREYVRLYFPTEDNEPGELSLDWFHIVVYISGCFTGLIFPVVKFINAVWMGLMWRLLERVFTPWKRRLNLTILVRKTTPETYHLTCASGEATHQPVYLHSVIISSLGIFGIAKYTKFLHTDNEDSDQTERMSFKLTQEVYIWSTYAAKLQKCRKNHVWPY